MWENAYLLIGVSVLMHVVWNLLARQVDSRNNFLWWGLLVHLLMLGPFALWQLLTTAIWGWSCWDGPVEMRKACRCKR
jgi:hypothetical protein